MAYNCTTIASSSYGDHWRNLRHIVMLEVLSAHRLNMSAGVRKDEVKILLRKMVTGKRYYGEEVSGTEQAKKFQELMEEFFSYAGVSYTGDFLPIFKYLDGQGYEKKVMKLSETADCFFQGLIDEHRRRRGDSETGNSVIDHFLSLQESHPEYYTDETIKGLAQTIVVAGSHTTAVTMKWAMFNLLKLPEVFKKVRAELEASVGSKQLLDETDLPKLQYLQNTISETHRLHPATPVITPHMSSDYCTLGGYTIPPKTILLVNAWAIHRDSESWDDPTCFNPERFGMAEVNTYKLLPFGLGRRACPGVALANRILGLTLGTLGQCFEWERINEKAVNVVEGTGGIVMPESEQLEALCKARSIMDDVLIQAVL
ncbi:hypothetical protein PTKIN_Ptkin08bG0116700 [Pterospermum kingtungense]